MSLHIGGGDHARGGSGVDEKKKVGRGAPARGAPARLPGEAAPGDLTAAAGRIATGSNVSAPARLSGDGMGIRIGGGLRAGRREGARGDAEGAGRAGLGTRTGTGL